GLNDEGTPESPIILGNTAFPSYLMVRSDWCIPGMDASGGCGGDNEYVVTGVFAPASPASGVAFAWGSQGSEVTVEISLSDGTSKVFTPSADGTTQHFTWCSGDPSVTITQ